MVSYKAKSGSAPANKRSWTKGPAKGTRETLVPRRRLGRKTIVPTHSGSGAHGSGETSDHELQEQFPVFGGRQSYEKSDATEFNSCDISLQPEITPSEEEYQTMFDTPDSDSEVLQELTDTPVTYTRSRPKDTSVDEFYPTGNIEFSNAEALIVEKRPHNRCDQMVVDFSRPKQEYGLDENIVYLQNYLNTHVFRPQFVEDDEFIQEFHGLEREPEIDDYNAQKEKPVYFDQCPYPHYGYEYFAPVCNHNHDRNALWYYQGCGPTNVWVQTQQQQGSDLKIPVLLDGIYRKFDLAITHKDSIQFIGDNEFAVHIYYSQYHVYLSQTIWGLVLRCDKISDIKYEKGRMFDPWNVTAFQDYHSTPDRKMLCDVVYDDIDRAFRKIVTTAQHPDYYEFDVKPIKETFVSFQKGGEIAANRAQTKPMNPGLEVRYYVITPDMFPSIYSECVERSGDDSMWRKVVIGFKDCIRGVMENERIHDFEDSLWKFSHDKPVAIQDHHEIDVAFRSYYESYRRVPNPVPFDENKPQYFVPIGQAEEDGSGLLTDDDLQFSEDIERAVYDLVSVVSALKTAEISTIEEQEECDFMPVSGMACFADVMPKMKFEGAGDVFHSRCVKVAYATEEVTRDYKINQADAQFGMLMNDSIVVCTVYANSEFVKKRQQLFEEWERRVPTLVRDFELPYLPILKPYNFAQMFFEAQRDLQEQWREWHNRWCELTPTLSKADEIPYISLHIVRKTRNEKIEQCKNWTKILKTYRNKQLVEERRTLEPSGITLLEHYEYIAIVTRTHPQVLQGFRRHYGEESLVDERSRIESELVRSGVERNPGPLFAIKHEIDPDVWTSIRTAFGEVQNGIDSGITNVLDYIDRKLDDLCAKLAPYYAAGALDSIITEVVQVAAGLYLFLKATSATEQFVILAACPQIINFWNNCGSALLASSFGQTCEDLAGVLSDGIISGVNYIRQIFQSDEPDDAAPETLARFLIDMISTMWFRGMIVAAEKYAKITSAVRNFLALPRDLISFVKLFVEAAMVVVDSFWEYFFGYPFTEQGIQKRLAAMSVEWVTRAREILAAPNNYWASEESFLKLVDVYNSGYKLVAATQRPAKLVNDLLARISMLYERLAITRSVPPVRQCPTVLSLIGETNQGKSTLVSYLVNDVIHDLELDYAQNMQIYTDDNNEDHFFNGYFGQFCYLNDEMFSTTNPDKIFEEATQFFSLVNVAPMMTNQADIENKGRVPFTSLMVLLTTNRRNWTNEQGFARTDPNALLRRFDVMVEVTLDRAKIPADLSINTDAWSFRLWQGGQPTQVSFNYKRLKELVLEAYKRHAMVFGRSMEAVFRASASYTSYLASRGGFNDLSSRLDRILTMSRTNQTPEVSHTTPAAELGIPGMARYYYNTIRDQFSRYVADTVQEVNHYDESSISSPGWFDTTFKKVAVISTALATGGILVYFLRMRSIVSTMGEGMFQSHDPTSSAKRKRKQGHQQKRGGKRVYRLDSDDDVETVSSDECGDSDKTVISTLTEANPVEQWLEKYSKSNICSVIYTDNMNSVRKAYWLWVCPNLFIANRHVVYGLPENTVFVVKFVFHDTLSIKMRYSDISWTYTQGSDVVFGRIDSNLEGVKTIKNFMPSRKFSPGYSTVYTVRVRLDEDGKYALKSMSYDSATLVAKPYKFCKREFNANSVYMAQGRSKAGDCVMPYCAMVDGKPTFLGVHFGLDGKFIVFAKVTQEHVDDASTGFQSFSRKISVPPSIFVREVDQQEVVYMPRRSVLMPLFEDRTLIRMAGDKQRRMPACLVPRNGVSPLEKAIAKFDEPDVSIPRNVITQFPDINGHRLLSWREAMFGIKEPILPWETKIMPMEMLTSAGYPWCVGHKGKYYLYPPDSLGERHPLPNFEEKYLRMEKDLEKGAVKILALDYLKDELRSAEKVASVSTRIISVLPLEFNLIFRRYFGSIIGSMMVSDSHCRVGVNPHGPGWKEIYDKIFQYPNVYSGDFSGFDRTIPSAFAAEFAEIDLVVERDIPWSEEEVKQNYELQKDVTERAKKLLALRQVEYKRQKVVRKNIMSSLMSVIHRADNVEYSAGHGNCSGQPATTVFNSFVNNNITAWALRKMGYEVGVNCDFVTYGDDNLIATRDPLDTERFSQLILQCGMRITFDKNQTGTFLKRGFRVTREGVFAPLDKRVIADMLLWYRKADITFEQNVRQRVLASLVEMFHYGPEEFNHWQKFVNRILIKAGLGTVHEEYAKYFARWRADALEDGFEDEEAGGIVIREYVKSTTSGIYVRSYLDEQRREAAQVFQGDDNEQVKLSKTEPSPPGTSQEVDLSTFTEPPGEVQKPRIEDRVVPIVEVSEYYQQLQRPYVIGVYTWTSTQAINTELTTYLSFPDALIHQPRLASLLSRYRFFRADVELEFRINSNRFQYGALIAGVMPCMPMYTLVTEQSDWLNFQTPLKPTSHTMRPTYGNPGSRWSNLTQMSQMEHVIISCQNNPVAKIVIPYRFPLDWIDISKCQPSSTAHKWYKESIGCCWIKVLSPLTSASPTPVLFCYVQVIARFVNIKVQGPSIDDWYSDQTFQAHDPLSEEEVRAIQESETNSEDGIFEPSDYTGRKLGQQDESLLSKVARMSKPFLTAGRKVIHTLSYLIPFGQIVDASAQLAGAVFGFSKPNVPPGAVNVYNNMALDLPHANGLAFAPFLGLNPSEDSYMEDCFWGEQVYDSISGMAAIKQYVTQVAANTTISIDTTLFQAPCAPFPICNSGVQWNIGATTAIEANHTYGSYYAGFFEYWTCEKIVWTVHFYASAYHQARFLLYWVPNNRTNPFEPTTATGGYGDLLTQQVVIEDGEVSVEFEVPWCADIRWKKTWLAGYRQNFSDFFSLVNPSTINKASPSLTSWVGFDGFSVGNFGIVCMNPPVLASTSDLSPVNIVVYQHFVGLKFSQYLGPSCANGFPCETFQSYTDDVCDNVRSLGHRYHNVLPTTVNVSMSMTQASSTQFSPTISPAIFPYSNNWVRRCYAGDWNKPGGLWLNTGTWTATSSTLYQFEDNNYIYGIAAAYWANEQWVRLSVPFWSDPLRTLFAPFRFWRGTMRYKYLLRSEEANRAHICQSPQHTTMSALADGSYPASRGALVVDTGIWAYLEWEIPYNSNLRFGIIDAVELYTDSGATNDSSSIWGVNSWLLRWQKSPNTGSIVDEVNPLFYSIGDTFQLGGFSPLPVCNMCVINQVNMSTTPLGTAAVGAIQPADSDMVFSTMIGQPDS